MPLRHEKVEELPEPHLTGSDLEQIARELDTDVEGVRTALAHGRRDELAAAQMKRGRKLVSRVRWFGLTGVLGLLSLLAIPTGQLFWLAFLGFFPLLIFALPFWLDLPSGYWRYRCASCNVIAGRYYRTAAASRGKRTLGRCPGCRGLRWFIVEPDPTDPVFAARADGRHP
jgi:hypothetical protein